MPYKRSSLRYAHTNGHSHCCYTGSGDNVITTGADGDIRVWNGVDDDDPNTQCLGEFVLYHVYDDKRILTSTDLNTVQAYTYPDFDRDGAGFRFTAPVTCIKVNDKYVAACSEDMTIKVMQKSGGPDAETLEFTEHEGPVLRIDLSKNGLLASYSGDGSIKIWELNEKKCIKTIKGFDKIKSYQETQIYTTPSFEPKNGKQLAYNQGKSIMIVNTTTWVVENELTDEKKKSKFSTCAYSKCGKFIAAGGENGEITIWDVNENKVVREDKNGGETEAQCITAIDWNPSNNGELAYTDNTGQFGLVENIFDSDENIMDDVDDVPVNDDMDLGDIPILDDPEDEGNENCVSLEKLKNETLKITNNDEIDDLLDGMSTRSGLPDNDDAKSDGRSTAMGNYVKTYQLQAPFQPGSTSRALEHRYMVWNHVGIVRSHATSSEDSIEVEFHDASVHHGLHMVNQLHHSMASLSSTVLALCNETPSKLVCIVLGGSGGSREWSMSMPNCEEILGVAASTKLVAVATDARYLRIFSAIGTQREILSLSGPVLALAAHEDRILVAYHSSPAAEDPHISMLLIQTIGLSLRCRDVPIALTPNSKLTWIGYSDRGSPVTCDSMGMLRMFSIRSNHWIPVCDTSQHTKGASDNFFIIEVSEGQQIVRAILCRGSSYPHTTPKPMVSELPMQLPLCDIEADQSQLEETLVRNSIFNANDSDKTIKEIAIKLFAIACRSENEPRAKELIEMLALPSLLPLAIKYASKLGRIHLAERLNELLPQLEEKEKDNEQYNENEAARELLLSTPTAVNNLIRSNQDKYSTPTVVPKPLSISQLKRNPFKKTPQSGGKIVSNTFRHLTDNALGFDSQETQDIDFDNSPATPNGSTNETTNGQDTQGKENLNNSTNTQGSKPNFIDWYKENKEMLMKENPSLSPAELTKFAMPKYQKLFTQSSSKDSLGGDASKSAKRKIESDGGNEQSGIAKLAKFTFNKQ